MFGTTASSITAAYNPNKSTELPSGPNDTPSKVAWHPDANTVLLAATAWDGSTRVWSIQQGYDRSITPTMCTGIQSDAPTLGCAFTMDNMLLTCGCDKTVKATNLQTNQTITVGQHDQPVQGVFAYPEKNMVVSGSWDGMIKLWDMRQQGAVMPIPLQQKLWAMDFRGHILGAIGNSTNVYVFDMSKPSQKPVETLQTKLKCQLRSIGLFRDLKGLAVGGIEGRCHIMHFSEMKATFQFKCHRTGEVSNTKVFPVNAIDFNQGHVFATAGAEGGMTFWDKDQRVRTHPFESVKQPIVDVSFNPTGKLIAYALGYDWHKGHKHGSECVNKIMVHAITDDMLRKK
eukprot:GHVU01208355.1.p1 GENE.GHVU01208355.1~~GHVU01208355.1.p1  ORF type:complete len:343 (+),score=45.55 GHVU01208355.1:118-1146(+)